MKYFLRSLSLPALLLVLSSSQLHTQHGTGDWLSAYSYNGNGTASNFDPPVAGAGNSTITTYTLELATGGDNVQATENVNSTFTAPADLCIDAGVQSGLGGGIPTGGVYSGPGVTDDGNGMTYAFDPAAAGVGVHSLTYTTAPSSLFSQLGLDIDGEAAVDLSGSSLSLSSDGTRVAIGAPSNDDLGIDAGHVRIYEWSGTAWVQLGQDIDGEASGDISGYSVSLSPDGSRVAIGAYRNDGGGSNAGQVRVYEWTGTVWAQLGLDLNGEAADDRSGISVSLSFDGSRVAIGAIDNDGGGSNAGHVRVYEWSGTAWVQLGLDIDGEAANDQSGYSVSLSSDGIRVAIGALFNEDGGGIFAGHVRIYEWSGTAWVQLGLDLDGEAAGDFSGGSVSLSSDGIRVAIGAANNDGGVGLGAGQVRIYEWSGTAWVQLGLDIYGETAEDGSGYSISLSSDGNRVAIGAKDNDGGGNNAGHVRIYDWNGTAWVQFGPDLDGEAADDQSGFFVSLSSDGSRVAIGANGNDGGGNNAGHVRIYQTCASCTNSVSDDVEVFALPVVTFTAPADVCIDAGVQSGLGGATPAGGVYSGPGVTDDGNGMTYSFDPAAAGPGTHTITYTAGTVGCSDSASDDVEVLGLSMGTFTAPVDFCVNAGVQAGLGGATPTGGLYSGPGVTDDANGMTYSFDPAAAGPGTHTITYTAGTVGCSDSASDDVEVLDLSTVTFTAPADVCIDAGVQSGLGDATPTGGVYSGPGVTDDGNGTTYTFDPAASGVGVHSLTYNYAPSPMFSQLGLDIDGEAVHDLSGHSVSISSNGTRIAIGAPYNAGGGVDAGHVRVYDWNGTAWVQLGLDIDGEAAGDQSGRSVSLSPDGSRVAIGANRNDGSNVGSNAGHVRIYEWNGTAWVQLGLDLDGQAGGVGLSVSLSFDGSQVAVGEINAGQVRIYRWTGTAWIQFGQDINSTEPSSSFGRSVSLSPDGNRVAIGEPATRLGDCKVNIYEWSGTAWGQLGIDLGGEVASDQFGWSVSLSSDGNRVAIGGYLNGGGGNSAGQVRIYEWSGTAWVQLSFDLDGEAPNDESGWSVSLSSDGNRVAIGAPLNDGGGESAGHVRIYDWTGTAWVQLGFDLDGEAPNDKSGWSVSLSSDGKSVAIGAISNGGSAGHVRIYNIAALCANSATDDVEVFGLPVTTFTAPADLCIDAGVQAGLGGATPPGGIYSGPGITDDGNGMTYSFDPATAGAGVHSLTYTTAPSSLFSQLGLDIDGEAADDNSGWSVSISSDGSRVAIGTPLNNGGGSNAGHVRIYDWTGTAWVQLGLDIDGEAAGNQSGYSVSLSSNGSRVAIGAPINDDGVNILGHVRIYDWTGTAWIQLGLDIDGVVAYGGFGWSVSLSSDGRRIAIGAPNYNDGAGHIRIYDWTGTAWVQLGLDIEGEAVYDQPGFSVSLSSDGSRVAIGAPFNNNNSGHVRIYEWIGTAWVQLGFDLDGEATNDRSGWSVSLSSDGSRVAIGAIHNDGGGSDAGHVRIYDWTGTAWVQLGLDIDGEAEGNQSGRSVSLSSDGSRVSIGAHTNDGVGDISGHVRIYDWTGTAWGQLSLDIDGEAADDQSGYSVSLSSDGSRVAIGAPGNDSGGFNAGHVRVYNIAALCANSATDDVEVFAIIPDSACPGILPIELTTFTGRTVGKQNIMEWTVASEEAFSHYELERSPNLAANWEFLGAVAGAGQVGMQAYTYTDVAPPNSAYYRLRMVDLDGSLTYSNIVHLQQAITGELFVYPNPNNGQFTVQLPTDESATLTLYDLNGRIVWQRKATSEVSVASLPDGVYLLCATTASNRWTKRIVVR